jgi:hypothetical protein
MNTVGIIKYAVFWGSSLSIAVLGTLITGPVVGLLAALGMTVGTNLWLDPASEAASRLLQPQSFHLWKTKKTLSRISKTKPSSVLTMKNSFCGDDPTITRDNIGKFLQNYWGIENLSLTHLYCFLTTERGATSQQE